MIGIEKKENIEEEKVIVEIVIGGDIKKKRWIRRDLIGKEDENNVELKKEEKLNIEIEKMDENEEEKEGKEVVEENRERNDVVDLMRDRKEERSDMILCENRVVERIGIIVELDDRERKDGELLKEEVIWERKGWKIEKKKLKRNDLKLIDKMIKNVEKEDEVSWNENEVEMGEDVLGNKVVKKKFKVDELVIFRVERGGVIFEELEKSKGIRELIKNFGIEIVNKEEKVNGFYRI